MTLADQLRAVAADLDRGAVPPELADRLARVVEAQALRLQRRDQWLAIAAAYVGNSPTRLHRVARRLAAARGSDDGMGASPLAVAVTNALALGPLPSRRRLAEILAAQRAAVATNDGAAAAGADARA